MGLAKFAPKPYALGGEWAGEAAAAAYGVDALKADAAYCGGFP